MKIYFTASIAGKKNYLTQYTEVIGHLKDLGATVLSDHIIKSNEYQINMESKEERLAFHKKLDEWISESNAVVAEVSYPSISVGFEISYALSKGKPVLVLYSNAYPPSLLIHYADEKLVCEKYSEKNVIPILQDFLQYVGTGGHPRLTFFISPTMANFLETVSKVKKIPKSAFIRSLIEKEMKKS